MITYQDEIMLEIGTYIHMNSYFSNNAVMCYPSGTILCKPTCVCLQRSYLGPIWAYPYGFAQKSPHSNFFVQFSLEKAVSSSTTHAIISSFLLQCFTSFVIDFKNKTNIKLNKKHIKNY